PWRASSLPRQAARRPGAVARYDPVGSVGARRVVVVGAGPAGLRAAAVAAGRGHEVIVHGPRDEPRGRLTPIGWVPARDGWAHAVEDMVSEAERGGARLRLGRNGDAAAVLESESDVVLIATGSTWDLTGASPQVPERPGIPGLEGQRAVGLDGALY